MKKLAIITTHPIQYYAPIFGLLNERKQIQIKVFYTWSQTEDGPKFDTGFGMQVNWDIPLLDGYDYTFVNNVSKNPGTHHYWGISNPAMIDEIENWKPDAVLVFGWSFISHLKCLNYFYEKLPVFFRGDSTLLDDKNGIKKILRRIFLTRVYRHINFAFYVGKENKRYFLKNGLRENQLIFAPHVIDNERFNDDNGKYKLQAEEWRKKLKIPVNEPVFLFAGKLEPKKNPTLLLDAFIRLNNSNIHLIMVGNGILGNELNSKYANNNNIHFLDFQNQSLMPVVYNLCDVFVLPSSGPGETWGLAVNEAMACSKPVVVSNQCGCAIDLVENGVNGYIFESNNLNALTKAMDLLLKSNLKKMGGHSFSKIQNYRMESVCEAIEKTVLIL